MTDQSVFWDYEAMQRGISMESEGTGQLEICEKEERRHCKHSDFLTRGKSKGPQRLLKGQNKYMEDTE